ncbi:MAG: Gfo/Idh/MocA family oxidoreductase [Caldilineaceae bacterium]|nr:Gfo/Idh/MocA family oxidoreductase [Caldilineaceae bacterium]
MIRWGIIGCGDVTEVKSGPAFQKATGSALVAVMRRNGALAADYAQRHGVPKHYDDGARLIADPEVDAVYVATPPDAHKEYTLMAAAAGKPVYVEKPMARNHAECLAMIEACDAADVPLWVAYYRRALPRFLKVKELLDGGAIGAVRTVTARLYQPAKPEQFAGEQLAWRLDPKVAGGGIFVDLASHTLDYLDYFLGPITQIRGFAGNQAGNYAAEDTVATSFVFASGVQGNGIWSFNNFENVDETEIAGERGKLTFASFEEAPVRLTTADGVREFHIPNPAHVHQPLVQSIVDELNGQGKCASTGVSGARANRLMDQILQPYYASR